MAAPTHSFYSSGTSLSEGYLNLLAGGEATMDWQQMSAGLDLQDPLHGRMRRTTDEEMSRIVNRVRQDLLTFLEGEPSRVQDDEFRAFYDRYRERIHLTDRLPVSARLARAFSEVYPDTLFSLQSSVPADETICNTVTRLKLARLPAGELANIVAQFPNLTYLDLSAAQVVDEDLACLAQLPRLTILSLYNCTQITNEALRCVSILLNLRDLDIGACYKLTDDGMSHLAPLSRLQKMSIWYCTGIGTRGINTLNADHPTIQFYSSGREPEIVEPVTPRSDAIR